MRADRREQDEKYPEPEGWGNDGFWRDPDIDSDYETGLTSPVRPAQDGPRQDPGYSYWSDGKGWEKTRRRGPGARRRRARPGGASPFAAAGGPCQRDARRAGRPGAGGD